MQKLRIGLVQLAWTGERPTMQDNYRRLVKQAVEQGAELVCLPEFSLSPYFPATTDKSGFNWAEPLQGGASDAFFGELASTHKIIVVGSIYEKADNGHYYDTATIHSSDGRLAYFTRKVHIPSGEGYYENMFFEGGVEYPAHDLGKVKISVPTCYDQWFPETARLSALNGAEFIFYPTAIGSEPTDPDFDSKDAWQTVMRGHAIANGVYVAAANRIGMESGLSFLGSSFICDPTGKIIAEAGRDTEEILVADLDPAVMERYRNLFPLLHQRHPDTYGGITQKFSQPIPDRWKEFLK